MAQQTDDSQSLTGTEPRYRNPYGGDTGIDDPKADHGRYGRMYTDDYEWDNVRCTKEAYGDQQVSWGSSRRRSLAFHTTWMDVGEAVECIEHIGDYNRFSPRDVMAVMHVAVPDNTRVVVGREGSPVLYLWTDAPKEVFTAFRSMAAAEATADHDEYRAYGPDELGGFQGGDALTFPTKFVGEDLAGLETGDPALLRCWWD